MEYSLISALLIKLSQIAFLNAGVAGLASDSIFTPIDGKIYKGQVIIID